MLKIAVIGVGRMGQYHVNVLDKIKHIHLVGIYDSNPQLADKVAKDYETQAFSSIDACLDRADAVVLAAPTSLHYELGIKILNHGVHVLIEKPLSNAYDKACKLVELADKKGMTLMVGHIERYNGAVQELGKMLENPYSWESHRIGPNTGRIMDVGVILDLIIHDIDICLGLVKSSVKKFNASGKKVFSPYEDLCHVHLELDNGCIASFVGSRVSHQKKRALHISQAKSTIELDFSTQDITVYRGGESIITTQPEQIRYHQQTSVEKFFIHKENPLKLELLDFIQTIEKKRSHQEQNILTLKTLKLSCDLINFLSR